MGLHTSYEILLRNEEADYPELETETKKMVDAYIGIFYNGLRHNVPKGSVLNRDFVRGYQDLDINVYVSNDC